MHACGDSILFYLWHILLKANDISVGGCATAAANEGFRRSCTDGCYHLDLLLDVQQGIIHLVQQDLPIFQRVQLDLPILLLKSSIRSTKIKYGLLSCKGSGQDKTTMQQTILIFELFPAPHLFQFQFHFLGSWKS